MPTKAYYAANREKYIEYNRAYREANRKKKYTEYNRAYHEANREKRVAYGLAHYSANREKYIERNRAYCEANQANCFMKQRWIYDARKERGYSLRVLAELVGVGYTTIRYLDLGKLKLDSFHAKDKLCAVLGREV